MKELSTEEKAKRFDEALERASNLHKDAVEMENNMTTKTCEIIFPELKESEDKIYKRAIRQMYSFLPNKPTYIGDVRVEDIFAWLEKQGTRPRYNIGDVICDKSCTTLNKMAQPNMEIVDIKNGMYICDKGSFPVSQQDEYELVSKKIDTKLNDDSVSNELRAASVKHAEKEIKNPTCPDNEEFELVYTFEEGAKWEAAQKSIRSKEDKKVFDEVNSFLEDLKKLK